VKRWQNHTLVESKLERIHEEIKESSSEITEEVAKYGAVEVLGRWCRFLVLKERAISFQAIKWFGLKKGSDDQTQKDSSEMKDLIKRNSSLLEERRTIKEECERLNSMLNEREQQFEEEKEVNAILSMRINYMITKKFLGDVTKVLDEVEDRHLNDAFDAIIDAANANLDVNFGDFE
jgi:hypothetical protein